MVLKDKKIVTKYKINMYYAEDVEKAILELLEYNNKRIDDIKNNKVTKFAELNETYCFGVIDTILDQNLTIKSIFGDITNN